MRLLLLIPLFILLFISGYNLANDFAAQQGANYLFFKVVHILMMMFSAGCIIAILRSMFKISKISTPVADKYEESNPGLVIEH
jgi:hypothetical protein